MQEKQEIEAILFDLDGTLWDSTKEILKTWDMVLKKHPECGRGPITLEELSGCLGLPMTEIAKRLFTNSTEEEQRQLMAECCETENAYLAEHGATLYPELETTLMKLKSRYKLYVVSNCQSGYIESFLTAHRLSDYFEDIECWGNNGYPKGENNKLIMQRNGITRAFYVGDTAGDEQSARDARIPFIFAAYGFGQAKNPDYVIQAFSELPALFESIDG